MGGFIDRGRRYFSLRPGRPHQIPPVIVSDPEQYMAIADERSIDKRDMEALAANTEQDWDVHQLIRHNLYIGWILGLLNGREIEKVQHGGGNQLEIHLTDRIGTITVIVPYPPDDWTL